MSKPTNLHSAQGIITQVPGIGILDLYGTGAPTASADGYATGCTYRRTDGSTDTALYLNEGSKSSATWVVLTTT